jgi:O-methyltransferase
LETIQLKEFFIRGYAEEIMKQAPKKGLEYFFDTLGIEAKFSKKDKMRNAIVFDQNQLAHYFYPDERMQLYFEGLNRAEAGWSDNFSKQFRLFCLQQIIQHVLVQELDADFAECGCWKGHSSFII